MKKPILFQLVLLIASFGPGAQCQERCLHFTNYCDSVSFERIGELANGGWDWTCSGDWLSASIIGNTKGLKELATRPAYSIGFYILAYTVHFTFKSRYLYDAYASDGREIFSLGSSQPYDIINNTCRRSDIDASKPSLMSRLRQTGEQPLAQQKCMHFTNFCDTIVLSQGTDEFSPYANGNWDWQCQADWTSSNILGNLKKGHELTTRTAYPGGNYATPYTSLFSFKAGQLFDLYQTNGLGGKIFAARTNQPFTLTDGACSPGDVDTSKPRSVAH